MRTHREDYTREEKKKKRGEERDQKDGPYKVESWFQIGVGKGVIR